MVADSSGAVSCSRWWVAFLLLLGLPVLAQRSFFDQMDPDQRAYLESRVFVVPALGATRAALPASVANTLHLPAVTSQGQLGVCGAYGITYYVKTYQEAREHGWVRPDPAVDPEHCATTAYTYKLLRHGPMAGASPLQVAQNMVDFGAAAWEVMPYTDTIITTTWPAAEFWRAAAPWRARAAGVIQNLHLPEGQRTLKAHLASGDLASLALKAGPNVHGYPGGKHTSNDVLYGLDANPGDDFHALTVFGYDDNREYIDDATGELRRGAFLAVNSWGPGWGATIGTVDPAITTKGFCWLAYDLFQDTENVVSQAVVMVDRAGYEPKLMMQLGIVHAESKLFGSIATSGRGDHVIDLFPGLSMDAQPTDQNIWVDVSDLAAYGRAGFRVSLKDFSPSVRGTVPVLRVESWDGLHGLNSPDVPAETRYYMQSPPQPTEFYCGRYQNTFGLAGAALLQGDAAWGDADGDGDLDLVLTGWFGGGVGWKTFYYENRGAAGFAEVAKGLAAGHTARWVDVDNDGDLDLLVGSVGQTRLYRNNGAAGFTLAAPLPGCEPRCLAVADFDNDGRPDLCIGNQTDTAVYRNDGTGAFTKVDVGLPRLRSPLAALRGSQIVAADLDGNGFPDLVVTGILSADPADCPGQVYLNQGLPLAFAAVGDPLPAVGMPALALADQDGDGDLDLAMSGCDGSRQTRLFRNDGNGRFAEIADVRLPNLHNGGLVWIDVNADGRPDLLATGRERDVYGAYPNYSYTNDSVVLTQTERGTYEMFGPPLPDVSQGVASTADVDGDGNPDILVGGTLAQIFETDVSKLTAAVHLHGAAFPGWYEVNSAPAAPGNLAAAHDGHGRVTFTWDDGADAETPAAALQYILRCGTSEGGNEVLSGAVSLDNPGLLCRSGRSVEQVPTGTLYWQVRTRDGAGCLSPWSAVRTLAVPAYTPRYQLRLEVETGYTGTTSPAPGVHVYNANQNVPVTTTPAPGFEFVGWFGDTAGVADTAQTTVPMTGHRILRARFNPIPDPENPAWTRQAAALADGNKTSGHSLESFGGYLLRMGGSVGGTRRNLVYVSSDGQYWQQLWQLAFEKGLWDWNDVPWPARAYHCSVVFNGKLWVMGGEDGWGQLADVWSTPNLFDWTKVTDSAPWGGRSSAACTVHAGKLWILGGDSAAGNLNDVWSSTNGSTWTQVTANAPWRAGAVQATTFNNRLVVLARGTDIWVANSEIWQSEDGANWERLTDSPAFGGRTGAILEVYNGQLVVAGGLDGSTYEVSNEVWTSGDGITWTRTAPGTDPHWTPRRYLASCLHDGKLWIVGGVDDAYFVWDDVWSLGAEPLPGTMGRLRLVALPQEGGTVTPPAGRSYVDTLGTVFELAAQPVPGYAFSHWVGPVADAASPSTTVVLAQDTLVEARFVSTAEQLVATVSPPMSGSVVPGTTQIPHGEWVTLTATAGFGYVFDHWEGDAAGITRTIEVLMDRPRTIRAVFVPDPYILPGAIACSATWATVVNTDGTLWAAGQNGNGQQGHWRSGNPGEFWPVALATGLRQAGINESGGIAITTQGKIVGWGRYWGMVDGQMQAHPVYSHLSGDIRGLSGMRTHYFFDRYGALFDGLNRPVEIGFNGEGLADVVALAEGPDSAFAVTRDGKLYAWGSNAFGQLGVDRAMSSHVYPQLVEAIAGARQVACGTLDLAAFTLVLLDDGTVWSWGDSTAGQLGRAGTADQPAPVPGLARIVKIVAGDRYGMALDQDGNLWGWGDNTFGQFGTGDYTDLAAAQIVATGIADVGAGPVYALVRRADGTFAWCGQVPGTAAPLTAWTVIPGLSYGDPSLTLDVSSDPAGLANIYPPAGQHRIAPNRPIPLHAEDTARYAFVYWSEGVADRLAADTTLTTATAASVSVRFRFQDDALAKLTVGTGVGGTTTPAAGEWGYVPGTVVTLRADPAVGYRFHSWQGAVGDTRNRTTTILMDRDQAVLARFVASPLSIPPQIATGRENNMGYDSLILHSDTRVQDYGAEASGSFVRLTTSANLDNVIAVAVGAQHQLALSRNGTVWSWDANQYGQCGTGETVENYTFPQQVRDAAGVLPRVARIAAGTHFSLALANDGTLYSWGRNQAGQLGHSGGEPLVREARPALSGVRAMACGDQFALAVKTDGTVLAWGAGETGQLGTAPGRGSVPTLVPGLPAMVDVAAGGTCAAALSATGEVWTWGGNGYGQLGRGTTGAWALPGKVAGLPVVTAVAVGPEHMLALDTNGTVWAWGRGDQGALGHGGTSRSSTPVQVLHPTVAQPLANIRSIDCHTISYAIDASGNLYQWGYDNSLFNDGTGIVSRPFQRGNYGAADPRQELVSLDLVCFPAGAGSISPQTGALFVNRGELVEIRARAAAGYRFVGWTGGISGVLPNVTVKVQNNLRAVACFEPAAPTLRLAPVSLVPGGTGRLNLFLEGDTASLEGIQAELLCPEGLQFGAPHRGLGLDSSIEFLYAVPEPRRAVLLASDLDGAPSLAADDGTPLAGIDLTAAADCVPGTYEVVFSGGAEQTVLSYAGGRTWTLPATVAATVEVLPESRISLLVVAAPLASAVVASESTPVSLPSCRSDREYYVELWIQDARGWGKSVAAVTLDLELPNLGQPTATEPTVFLDAVSGAIAGQTVLGFGGTLVEDILNPGQWTCLARLRVNPQTAGEGVAVLANARVELADGTELTVPAIRAMPTDGLLLAQVPNEVPVVLPTAPLAGRWGAQISGSLRAADANPDDVLTYTLVAGPAHGQLIAFDPLTGAFTYLADPFHSGGDRFTFTVSDGTLESAVATQELFVSQGWCASLSRGAEWCAFGQDADDDEALDMPAPGNATLAFQAGDSQSLLQRDMRPLAGTAVWRLAVAAKPEATVLSWNPLDIPDGLHMVQLAPGGGAQVLIDLRATASIELLADTAYLFDLAMPELCDLTLQNGWNLVAFPGTPVHDDVAALFAPAYEGGPAAVWLWNEDGYDAPVRLDPFVGYWLYASGDMARSVAVMPAFANGVQLRAGWNLIGVPYPTALPTYDNLSSLVWTFRNLRYEPVSRLVPGTGYWVYAFADLMLVFAEENAP